MIKFDAVKASGKAFLDVFYPDYCQICHQPLVLNEHHICFPCAYDLPFINHDPGSKKALQQLFWGRVDIDHVYSLLNYQKGNATQKLLHQIKYKGKKKLGRYLGGMLGEQLTNAEFDLIIPVPLHPKRERERGFNQSHIIAKGIANKCSLPINDQCLLRKQYSKSQTKFSRFDRWDNVSRIFWINQSTLITGKKILLVDDVVTTGATLEAAAHQLLNVEGVKISIATIAARI
ncbi:phosphoribosyltransferase family protein [Crocinitomicaceae bacterium]|jgi:competence protein ComFC|nr:phosphoribosyltransferase family protein [Crocinitomicaceae bacterium]